MNTKSLYKLSYGVYLLSAREGDRDNACVINTAVQTASNPTRISVASIKGGYTHDMIARTGQFNVSSLTEEAPMELFRRFGMQSGRDTDKLAGFADTARSANGLLYLTKYCNAFLSVKVTESHDLGSHTLFIGEMTDGEVLSDAPSATYNYYQTVIKARAAKPAPAAGKPVKKWVCPVCGYVYEGPEPPDQCPVCHVPGSRFTERKPDASLAAEHTFGVYGKTVAENPDISGQDKKYILDQLKANFTGECSEVGLYLCMARVADREGDAQMADYWRKAAREEAEHAAKFAELLGSDLEPNMTDSTKKNLAWRVDCEFGATQGKFDLAACAKKNGLDAIHDTVHEMARDEARHGKALKGLLERYFK